MPAGGIPVRHSRGRPAWPYRDAWLCRDVQQGAATGNDHAEAGEILPCDSGATLDQQVSRMAGHAVPAGGTNHPATTRRSPVLETATVPSIGADVQRPDAAVIKHLLIPGLHAGTAVATMWVEPRRSRARPHVRPPHEKRVHGGTRAIRAPAISG